jgi:ABC-2 type transport system permease protein
MKAFSQTNKNILTEMVRTDFKLRYQGSVLGYFWSLLQPLLLSLILYIVFVKFLKIGDDIRHKASYLLLGIMLWTFFIEMTSGAVGSVVGKGDLIPRYLTVVSTSVSALINITLNSVVLAIIMAVTGVEVKVKLLVFVPLLLIELYIFALSLGFILSAAFVKFRDVSFIWGVTTQMLFYLTPIIYPMSYVLDKYKLGRFIILSPVAQVIQDLRNILVTPQSTTTWQIFGGGALVPLMIVGATLAFSVYYFRKESRYFAENV